MSLLAPALALVLNAAPAQAATDLSVAQTAKVEQICTGIIVL